MKLLIVTQVVDTEHPILGFFHRWIAQFAHECEEVIVICLQEGKHDLPDNVRVYSLGKESSKLKTQNSKLFSRLAYSVRFLSLIWQHRNEYDAVFVHMNQIYVIIGGLIWRMLGKKIGLWYTHKSVTPSLRLATLLTHTIFTASPESFRIDTPKKHVMGHGIDTEVFSPSAVAKDIDLITVGRIAQSKDLLRLVHILKRVRETYDVSLSIIGTPITDEERVYEAELRAESARLDLTDHVHFLGAVPHEELPQYLNRARVFVHAATTGSLDKTLLEALACELPLITNADGAASLPLADWRVTSDDEFVQKVGEVLRSSTSTKTTELRQYVVETHGIEALINSIHTSYAE